MDSRAVWHGWYFPARILTQRSIFLRHVGSLSEAFGYMMKCPFFTDAVIAAAPISTLFLWDFPLCISHTMTTACFFHHMHPLVGLSARLLKENITFANCPANWRFSVHMSELQGLPQLSARLRVQVKSGRRQTDILVQDLLLPLNQFSILIQRT